jgi:hypothetical protein
VDAEAPPNEAGVQPDAAVQESTDSGSAHPSDANLQSTDAGIQSIDSGSQSTDSGAETHITALLSLSLVEAPAPTRTFYWGKITVTAPGFYVPPRDVLTLALDADNHLRYRKWKTLASFPQTFGDAAHEFPVSGTKQVDTHPDYNSIFDVTVEASESTSTHFLHRMHVVSTDGLSDYVESTEGTRAGDGWMVVYSEKGKYFGAQINANASGVLYAGDPSAPAPAGATLWSAPVEVVAPGFAGTPVDHLTVALDAQGRLTSFSFDDFVRSETFGSGPDDIPLSGVGFRGDVKITVDDVVAPTASHFVIRYHVEGSGGLNDYIEGIDGTRSGDTLTVRHFIKGNLFGAKIDAHAAGTLVPASAANLVDDPIDAGI